MNPAMYLITDPALGMSKGKFGAQAGHAAVETYRNAVEADPMLVQAWLSGGHYTKIVLMTDDIMVTERYLKDRGFDPILIIDEGRTEFSNNLTPTFLGILVDKDDPHAAATFSTFKTYRDPKPPKQNGKIIDFKEAKKRLIR